MPATLRYGRLCALVYQLDKPIGSSFGDVEFYRDRLAGVTGEILEPAVGTGRILIPLLRAGLRVRGYDLSPHMLDVCRANCAEHGLDPLLFEADMVEFRQPGAFAAVIVPAGSFALVTGRENAEAALRNIHECLAPGGRFIVDVEPSRPPASTQPPLRHWWDGDDLVTLTAHDAVEPEPDRSTVWCRYELWREGVLVRTELEPLSLQRYERDEFAGMLRDAGFTTITVHGDYQAGAELTADTNVWTFEATAGRSSPATPRS